MTQLNLFADIVFEKFDFYRFESKFRGYKKQTGYLIRCEETERTGIDIAVCESPEWQPHKRQCPYRQKCACPTCQCDRSNASELCKQHCYQKQWSACEVKTGMWVVRAYPAEKTKEEAAAKAIDLLERYGEHIWQHNIRRNLKEIKESILNVSENELHEAKKNLRFKERVIPILPTGHPQFESIENIRLAQMEA